MALVTHYFPAHRGGVEAVAWELASRLAASGAADITWYSSDTDDPPARIPGLRCVPMRAWNAAERRLGIPFPVWSPAALSRLAGAVRQADVVHLHDCLYLPNVVAWAAARRSGIPVIVTQHVGAIPYRRAALRLTMVAATRLLGRLLLGSAAQTIFVSEAVLAYFRGFVAFRRPPLRVPNGVDTRLFFPVSAEERQALRARWRLRPGQPLLLFAGRFVEKKGLRLLHRLAQALPQTRWVFAGWGPLDPSAWGLPNVSVESSLTQAQLVPLYQAADLLVLPSVGEGFPLVVQEAMGCGTPALVSDETAQGQPEAAGVLLHEPVEASGDAAPRWSARLEALLASPATLQPLRERVAEFARAHWSWERCAQHYAEALRACSR